jgi:hypothetical protein
MTHVNELCDMCDIYHKCVTHVMCHTVTHYDTLAQIGKKIALKSKNM